MVDTTVEIPTRVLVLGMAHEDGTILASELHPVAEACGQTAEQVRSCLRRIVSEGLWEREGSGRDAVYRATPRGMAELGATMERTRLAYGQDAAGRGWDRKWHLVAFAVPEHQRAARDSFRGWLRLLGGAAVQGGLYVSPHPWDKDVRGAAERLGIGDSVTLATTDDLEIAGDRDPRQLARRLWPIDWLAEQYQAFVQEWQWVPGLLAGMKARHEKLADAEFTAGALRMTVALKECFDRDPLLPPELLPRPWPGREARSLLLKSRRTALTMRQAHGRPGLFRLFDDVLESLG